MGDEYAAVWDTEINGRVGISRKTISHIKPSLIVQVPD